MGYYGLGPGMQVKDNLSPLEHALFKQMPVNGWNKTLTILEKLCKNVAQNPNEEKFRRIKLDNAKILEAVTSVEPAVAALLEMGWVAEVDSTDNGIDNIPAVTLVLPRNIKLNQVDHVNKIIDARHELKKREESTRVENGLSRAIPAGMEGADKRSADEVQAAGKATLQKLASTKTIY